MKFTKKKKIMLAAIVVILGIIISMMFVIVIHNNNKQNVPKPYGNSQYFMDENNLVPIETDIANFEKVEEGLFEVNMNVTWHFKNGSNTSENAYVANSDSNNCPVVFDISLSGTEDLIYTSTVIPVGSKLNEITLNEDLEPGSYPAVCTYHLLNEDGDEISTVGVNLTLVVE